MFVCLFGLRLQFVCRHAFAVSCSLFPSYVHTWYKTWQACLYLSFPGTSTPCVSPAALISERGESTKSWVRFSRRWSCCGYVQRGEVSPVTFRTYDQRYYCCTRYLFCSTAVLLILSILTRCTVPGTDVVPHTPLFMGAESCEKSESLQTFFATFLMYALYGSKKLRKKFGSFTFDNNRAIWSKSLQTFRVANVAEESCTAEKIPVRGSAKS